MAGAVGRGGSFATVQSNQDNPIANALQYTENQAFRYRQEDEAKKAKDEKDEEEEEEEIDLESMSPEDLEDFIKGVIKDLSASGELEGGNEEESEEE